MVEEAAEMLPIDPFTNTLSCCSLMVEMTPTSRPRTAMSTSEW